MSVLDWFINGEEKGFLISSDNCPYERRNGQKTVGPGGVTQCTIITLDVQGSVFSSHHWKEKRSVNEKLHQGRGICNRHNWPKSTKQQNQSARKYMKRLTFLTYKLKQKNNHVAYLVSSHVFTSCQRWDILGNLLKRMPTGQPLRKKVGLIW